MSRRPPTVLAMWPGMERYVFDDEVRARLAEVADVLDPEPLADLTDARALDLLARAEVLLTHWGAPVLDATALDAAPQLRLVAHGAGTVKDHVSAEVFERGIVVTSAAAANARPVAHFTLAAILFAAKDAFGTRERQRPGGADQVWPDRRRHLGIDGRRVGIIGASSVGRLVIELLRPLPVHVAVSDPHLSPAEASELGVELVELDDLVRTSEILSVHAPALPSTHRLIDAARLAAMPTGATLINTARGSLVDHDALAVELAAGRLSAILDVTDPEPLPDDHPLRGLDTAFITPHIAGSMGSEVPPMSALAVEEIARFAAGLPPAHEVRADDLPRLA